MTAPSARPVAVTGLGSISCLGQNMNQMWASVSASRSGIHNGLGRVKVPADNRALEYCQLAAREAMQQAGWTQLEPSDGLIFATTTGQILLWDAAFMGFSRGERTLSEFSETFVHQRLGQLMTTFAESAGFTGPMSLLTTACSAGTQAVGLGAMWVRQGRVKRCLVVGVEVLCDLTTEGFRSLQLLATDHCQPFDSARKGINLSEGAAAICLEAVATNPLAYVSGFGFSTDGFHMTGPHPEGDGSYRAMHMALQTAALKPIDITWVHAHGTGSQQNDLSEGFAIQRLFGEEQPWVSSTKWLHGHALGASGVLEAVLVSECIRRERILFTRGLVNPDPRIPIRHPHEDLEQLPRHVLKSTLGFGGANAAVVFSHPEAVLL